MTLKTISLVLDSSTNKNEINVISTPERNNIEPPYSAPGIRWLMLLIFICFTFINSAQWGGYIIISNLVQKYYGVSGNMVDNTTIVYMVTYIPLIFPALWLLHRTGTRFCLMLSCTGLFAGACIKLIASFHSDMFFLVLIGQSVVAAFQVLAFGLAARVAAVWFPANQVSLACSLAVFGDQFGTAIGFFLPVIVVNEETEDSIGRGLVNLNIIIAGSTLLILIVALLFFKEAPPSPPSAAQAICDGQPHDVLPKVKSVLKEKAFIMMMLAYGILNAGFNAYIAVLNDIFLQYFPKEAEIHVGMISFLMMISGIIGSIFFGWLFDKTHMYKGLTLLMYICGTIVTLINIFVPQLYLMVLFYVSNMIVGFFMIGYYSVGIQLAIEITFPVPESIVSSLLLLPCQLIGIPFMKIYRWLFDTYGYAFASSFLFGALILGCILTAVIPAKLKRTAVNTCNTCHP